MLGSTWLTPRLKEFIELYQEILVSLQLTDGELDLTMWEVDVALRMSPPRQLDLIQRQLLRVTTMFMVRATISRTSDTSK